MPAAPSTSTARALDCRGRPLPLGTGTQIVGILNATPDSFFDGGRWLAPERAAERAERMAAEGAAAVDLGGQSTRPGYEEISEREEIARTVPVLERIVPALSVPISIDAYRPEVARAALRAGAHWVNDVRGFQGRPAMAELVAEYGCPAVLMHWEPSFPEERGDVMDGLARYFERSLERAAAAGIPAERIVLDPGIGFFKTSAQQLEILRRLPELKRMGCPILLGVSRKSIVGHVLGGGPEDRLEGTLATTVLAVRQGVDFIRVHDVRENALAARMAAAILRGP
ncbi:MAG: dihydropteroate synthase [Opitutaceae bacterium]